MMTENSFRYFVQLSYNGSAYHGWQIQPNAKSVQETLEYCFSKLLCCDIAVCGAGRTDTGVHAKNYILHFDIKNPLDDTKRKALIKKMNNFLPDDIVIHQIYQVDNELHARFNAKKRTYKYYIHTEKNPFQKQTSFFIFRPLNIDLMNQACEMMKSYQDFSSFSKLHTQTKTNNCDIMHAHWEENDHQIVFTITADRFLRNMVRAIVGTLLELGYGKINLEQFRAIIESKDRAKAGYSVPAHALFLIDIEY